MCIKLSKVEFVNMSMWPLVIWCFQYHFTVVIITKLVTSLFLLAFSFSLAIFNYPFFLGIIPHFC